MEAIRRLEQHINVLYFCAYYIGPTDDLVDGVSYIGKGSFARGLGVKDPKAHRELQRIADEIDRLVDSSEHRLARKYDGKQFINEGASGEVGTR
jgi:hypothetical protein